MSAEANRELVLKFCRHLSDRDLDEMFGLMAEDGTWSGVGNPETFKYGGMRTKAKSVNFIGGFLNSFATFRFDVVTSTAEQDRVALEATSRGVAPGGQVYENQYILVFQCRDGMIVRINEYFDQIAVLEYERSLGA